MLSLKIDISPADFATLEELAKRQWRTAGGQASFLIHQLLEQHKNGRVQLAPPAASNGGVVASKQKPLEWETGE